MTLSRDDLIKALDLRPLLGEGGLFRNTYRSKMTVKLPSSGEDRPAGTCIYYLLTPDNFSHLHSLKGDEIYHFYLGDPVELLVLGPGKSSRIITLGQDLAAGMQVQQLVPAGTCQGLRLKAGGAFALLGTTMTPGYDERDYRPGDRETLIKEWPDLEEIIRELTGSLAY